MSDRIHELLHRNLQEVFGEDDAANRLAAIGELYTDDCILYAPPGIFAGTEPSISFWAISVRTTRISFTPRMARPKPSTTPGVDGRYEGPMASCADERLSRILEDRD
jgi:hypothetical protein